MFLYDVTATGPRFQQVGNYRTSRTAVFGNSVTLTLECRYLESWDLDLLHPEDQDEKPWRGLLESCLAHTATTFGEGAYQEPGQILGIPPTRPQVPPARLHPQS